MTDPAYSFVYDYGAVDVTGHVQLEQITINQSGRSVTTSAHVVILSDGSQGFQSQHPLSIYRGGVLQVSGTIIGLKRGYIDGKAPWPNAARWELDIADIYYLLAHKRLPRSDSLKRLSTENANARLAWLIGVINANETAQGNTAPLSSDTSGLTAPAFSFVAPWFNMDYSEQSYQDALMWTAKYAAYDLKVVPGGKVVSSDAFNPPIATTELCACDPTGITPKVSGHTVLGNLASIDVTDLTDKLTNYLHVIYGISQFTNSSQVLEMIIADQASIDAYSVPGQPNSGRREDRLVLTDVTVPQLAAALGQNQLAKVVKAQYVGTATVKPYTDQIPAGYRFWAYDPNFADGTTTGTWRLFYAKSTKPLFEGDPSGQPTGLAIEIGDDPFEVPNLPADAGAGSTVTPDPPTIPPIVDPQPPRKGTGTLGDHIFDGPCLLVPLGLAQTNDTHAPLLIAHEPAGKWRPSYGVETDQADYYCLGPLHQISFPPQYCDGVWGYDLDTGYSPWLVPPTTKFIWNGYNPNGNNGYWFYNTGGGGMHGLYAFMTPWAVGSHLDSTVRLFLGVTAHSFTGYPVATQLGATIDNLGGLALASDLTNLAALWARSGGSDDLSESGSSSPLVIPSGSGMVRMQIDIPSLIARSNSTLGGGIWLGVSAVTNPDFAQTSCQSSHSWAPSVVIAQPPGYSTLPAKGVIWDPATPTVPLGFDPRLGIPDDYDRSFAAIGIGNAGGVPAEGLPVPRMRWDNWTEGDPVIALPPFILGSLQVWINNRLLVLGQDYVVVYTLEDEEAGRGPSVIDISESHPNGLNKDRPGPTHDSWQGDVLGITYQPFGSGMPPIIDIGGISSGGSW